MIKSMTGYGRVESVVGEEKIVVEVKSINHRYCDICLHISPKCSSFENEIKKLILSRISRGRIDLSIQFGSEEVEGQSLELNLPLARRYYLLLKQLREELKLSGEIKLSDILTQKDMIVSRPPNQNHVYDWAVLKEPISSALDELVKMRKAEGLLLKEDFLSRLKNVELLLDHIKSASGSALPDHQENLRQKMRNLCNDIAIDKSRLAQEAAYLVEKSDITEELVRAQSHLLQFKNWLDSEEAVGRKLDFLIQEIHREINTTGSKSCKAEISLKAVEIKNELERIREQVQNIE